MAFDEDLADRLRVALQHDDHVTEQKMFGGHAFLVGGHLAVAASGQGGLLLRCDPALTDEHLVEPGVSHFVMRGRPMDGWLRVEAAVVETDAALARWAQVGAAYAASLPPT